MPLSAVRGRAYPRWGQYLALVGLVASLGVPLALLPVTGEDKPAQARHGMVVAVSAPGADVGRDILLQGGNAVDAAVATAFAMAVTYPAAGNIGGGGFMVIHPPQPASRSSSITARRPRPRLTPACSSPPTTGTATGSSACPAPCAAWPWLIRASASCPGKTWSCRR